MSGESQHGLVASGKAWVNALLLSFVPAVQMVAIRIYLIFQCTVHNRQLGARADMDAHKCIDRGFFIAENIGNGKNS
ncbi:hypothetical protein AAKU55_005427 [Oxalobacteraceae bacterium GrIS 1.11]